MTEGRYPRRLIESLLVRTAFSESYRGKDAYAIYDRSIGKLEVGGVGQLEKHVELAGVLERHAIALLI